MTQVPSFRDEFERTRNTVVQNAPADAPKEAKALVISHFEAGFVSGAAAVKKIMQAIADSDVDEETGVAMLEELNSSIGLLGLELLQIRIQEIFAAKNVGQPHAA